MIGNELNTLRKRAFLNGEVSDADVNQICPVVQRQFPSELIKYHIFSNLRPNSK